MTDDLHNPEEEPETGQADNVDFDDELLAILAEAPKQAENELFDSPGYAEPKTDGSSIENPKLSHELYHGTLEKLLRRYLPKRNSAIETERIIAKTIRDLVNLYLKEGKKRGADGKMAYNYEKAVVASVIIEWANAYGGSNFADLYNRLVDLCEKKGYTV